MLSQTDAFTWKGDRDNHKIILGVSYRMNREDIIQKVALFGNFLCILDSIMRPRL